MSVDTTPAVRTSGNFQSPNPSGWAVTKRVAAARLFQRAARLREVAAHLGELADYVGWLQSRFGDFNVSRDREEIWESMIPHMKGQPATVFEFGVAWGYATHWWLSRNSEDDIVWHGFDTFVGLPAQYRGWAPGSFSAEGQVPAIDDSRVTWHVGLVEETLPLLPLDRRDGERWVVLFDLDLYEPSKFAWDLISEHLLPGDLLYFDEAYDSNERRLLDETVIPFGEYEFLAANTLALGLRLVSRRSKI